MRIAIRFDQSNAMLRRRRCAAAQGFLYIAVLFTSLLVMVAVSAALTISTTNLRSESDRRSRGEALRFAESEIHRQVAMMRNDGSWRSTQTHDQFVAWHGLTLDGNNVTGDSVVRHRFRDDDGDLNDSDYDSVELTVHARVDQSEAAVSVQLEPDLQPLDLLGYAITCSDDLRFEDGGTISAEWPVQVADDCKTNTSGILTTPTLHCSDKVEMTLRGDLAPASVALPPRNVVSKYVSMGTRIPRSAVPGLLFTLYITDRVLSPSENPFGEPDPNGIYWLNAGGMDVVISDCHLRATLAIRNAGRVEVRGGMVWHYPGAPDVILATDSRIDFEDIEATLDEAARGENFNPSSAPYRGTVFDSDRTDVFPTDFRGIIYSTSNIRFDPLASGDMLRIAGNVIGRDVRVECHLAISPLPQVLIEPPASLADPTPMRFIRGSFRRIPSP